MICRILHAFDGNAAEYGSYYYDAISAHTLAADAEKHFTMPLAATGYV